MRSSRPLSHLPVRPCRSGWLGYRADGSTVVARRGEPAEDVRLLVTPETFVRPQWSLHVDGLDGRLPLLGACG